MSWSRAERFFVARSIADAVWWAHRTGTPFDPKDVFRRPPKWLSELGTLTSERAPGPNGLRRAVEHDLVRLERRGDLPGRPPKLVRWSIVELRRSTWRMPAVVDAHDTHWSEEQLTAVSTALGAAFRSAAWNRSALLDAAARVAVAKRPYLSSIVEVVLRVYATPPVDAPAELASVLRLLLDEQRAVGRLPATPPHPPLQPAGPQMARRRRWPIPEAATPGDLAALLDLRDGELLWLADTRNWEQRADDERLRNYRYRWINNADRRSGRLIESPKGLLRETQRRLLHQILDQIPAHDAAHGFRRGHSVLTHARRHIGRQIVFRWDIERFFTSIAAGRIYGIFRTAGYPEQVARLLTGLTTNATPAQELRVAPWPVRRQLAIPHLPQGAPTSPALANLACYRLDSRLAGLADAYDATYSRYADDIVISTNRRLGREIATLHRLVTTIVEHEGFQLNDAKTRLMPRSSRQHTCGVTVNDHPNVGRREADRLRAILHDATLNGPSGANRQGHPDFHAHLLGRIAWVASVNPSKGARLRQQFGEIRWDEEATPYLRSTGGDR